MTRRCENCEGPMPECCVGSLCDVCDPAWVGPTRDWSVVFISKGPTNTITWKDGLTRSDARKLAVENATSVLRFNTYVVRMYDRFRDFGRLETKLADLETCYPDENGTLPG